MSLSEQAAIAGIGATEFSKNSGVTTLTLALRAIRAAADDAGVAIGEIDGIATHRVGDSVPASVVAQALGMTDPRYFVDHFGGGGSSQGLIGTAAMAVASGVADHVVCYRAINARSEFRMGGTGRPPVEHVETQYQAPYGYGAPPQLYALAARAYMDKYGADERDFGAVAITQRRHAALNPRAMMRQPISYEDYLSSRPVVDPFRLLDCCLETDVGLAVLLCRPELARHLRHPPVLIRAVTWGGGTSSYSGGAELLPSAARKMAPRLWQAAGMTPADIDVANIYDCFTFAVLLQLEDYGFCAPGEAGAFVRSGATALAGALPVNPHGGFLSEGYGHGMNHVIEAVEQLRGVSGPRQVAGAEVALCTGAPGYAAGATSAMVLRRAS
jgi:acetyl-CoA acetyltransferase